MQETRLAYIYSRVSKQKQTDGDGIKRQIDRAKDFVASKNVARAKENLPTYTIIDDLILDEGLSAYHGLNQDENAGLGAFIEAAKNGKIPPNSLLVIEAVDRISRLHADDTRAIFKELSKLKIDVGIVRFGLIVRHDERADLGTDLLLTAAFHLANMESEQKSYRILAANKERIRIEDNGGEKRTKTSPGWIRLSDDRLTYELIHDHAEKVRRIFAMKIDGLGCPAISKKLNGAGDYYFDNSAWTVNRVDKCLKSIQAMGHFQRTRTKHQGGKRINIPVGDVKKDYYPAVVDEVTFIQAQQSFRKTQKGQIQKNFRNLFSGLIKCPSCGSTMSFESPNRGFAKVRCTNRIRKDQTCTQKHLYYDPLDQILKKGLAGLDYSKLNDSSFDDLKRDIAIIEHEIEGLEEKATVLSEQIKATKNGRMVAVLTEQLGDTYEQIDKLAESKNRKISVKDNYDATMLESLNLDSMEGRRRYNHFVKQYVNYIIAGDRTVKVMFKGKVGLLNFYLDKNNDPAHISDCDMATSHDVVREVFTNGKDKDSLVTPFRLQRFTPHLLEKLSEITTIEQPKTDDYLENLKYLFKVQVEIDRDPKRWGHLAYYAR